MDVERLVGKKMAHGHSLLSEIPSGIILLRFISSFLNENGNRWRFIPPPITRLPRNNTVVSKVFLNRWESMESIVLVSRVSWLTKLRILNEVRNVTSNTERDDLFITGNHIGIVPSFPDVRAAFVHSSFPD